MYGPHCTTPGHPQHQAMVRRVYEHGAGIHQSVDWGMCAWYELNVHTCMVHTHHIQRWEGACTTHARPRASHVVLNVHVGVREPYGCTWIMMGVGVGVIGCIVCLMCVCGGSGRAPWSTRSWVWTPPSNPQAPTAPCYGEKGVCTWWWHTSKCGLVDVCMVCA